jgi:hypothetical protein
MTTLCLHLGSGAPYEVESPHTGETVRELAASILRADVGVHAVDLVESGVCVAHVDRCTNCGAIVTTETPDEDDTDAECQACARLAQRVALMPTLSERESRIRWACTGATFAPEVE